MVYKEHLPWCFDSLASSPTYFLIRCRQAFDFIRKFFCQGSNFSKSTKVGPKYVLLSVWDFLRKKIYPYKKTSSNNQAGMSLIFPTKPVFLFSKQNWYVSLRDGLQKISYISSREYFVILPHKDHLKRRCSNNQVRGKL